MKGHTIEDALFYSPLRKPGILQISSNHSKMDSASGDCPRYGIR